MTSVPRILTCGNSGEIFDAAFDFMLACILVRYNFCGENVLDGEADQTCCTVKVESDRN